MLHDGYYGAFSRVFKSAECRTQVELAKFLGLRQSAISDAKRRQAIPAEWLIKLLRFKGINPEWILTGIGPKYLVPTSEEPSTHLAHFTGANPFCKHSLEELLVEIVRRVQPKV